MSRHYAASVRMAGIVAPRSTIDRMGAIAMAHRGTLVTLIWRLAATSVIAGILSLAVSTESAYGDELTAHQLRLRNDLSSALDAQDRWLGSGANADAWRNWLHNDALRAQLTLSSTPDWSAVYEALARYRGREKGLDANRFQQVRSALERWLHALPGPAPTELATLARETRSASALGSTAQVTASLEAVQAAFDKLESVLARNTLYGEDWRAYLRCDELAAELVSENAQLDRLESILTLYQAGHAGLELSPYRAVERTLAQHCRQLRVARLDDPATALADRLERIATNLERYERRPKDRHLQEIAEALSWLQAHALAPAVVYALESSYLRPNFYAQIDGQLVFSQFEQDIDEQFTIRDSMNGASISGTGRLSGHVGFELVPSEERAAIQMLFEGNMRSNTTGFSSPVGFSTSGYTQLHGQKWLFADADGVHTRTADTQAETSLQVNNVWSTSPGPLRNRLTRRIGWKRVLGSRSSSEQRISRRAADDLQQRFESEASQLVVDLNETYVEALRVPLTEQGVFPRQLGLSTTRTHLQVHGTIAANAQLAAMSSPPQVNNTAAAAMTIHESLINNVAATTLSGQTLESYELADMLEQMLGSVPQGFDTVDGIPWSLTVAESRPLEARIQDEKISVTIRCVQIAAGPEIMNVPFSVTGHYRGAIDGAAIVFTRMGELEFNAPTLDAFGTGNDGVTDSQEQVVERFEMIFAEEHRFTSDDLPLELPPDIEFYPTDLQTSDGWLAMAFDTRPVAESEALVSTASGD